MSTMTRARGGRASRPAAPVEPELTCERRMPTSPGTRALTVPAPTTCLRGDDCEEWREEWGGAWRTYRLCYCT